MNEKYNLKIGNNQIFSEDIITNLSSEDPQVRENAENFLKKRLKETRISIGTLLKTDNISFLLGAGASMGEGGIGLGSIPSELEKLLHEKAKVIDKDIIPEWLSLFYTISSALTGKDYNPKERRALLDGDLSTVSNIDLNLEDYLSHLHMWLAGMGNFSSKIMLQLVEDNILSLSKVDLEILIKEINMSLTSLVDLPHSGKGDSLKAHRRFIKKVLTRPLNLRRPNIFTLNYDTLIEKAADAEGSILVDGFVGTLKRIFRPESYDLDFYFPAQTTEGRVHRYDRVFHLYKLHGSITWHRCEANWENPYGLYATFYDPLIPKEDVLIYPSPLKYGQALGLPYSELFRRFGTAIAQPQSVLFTIGYGFGDEHVNSLIQQSLAIPSFTLVIIDPSPKNTFVEYITELGDERIWLVSGWELGTFANFVEKLLPDLREEEITNKMMNTYRALTPTVQDLKTNPEMPNDDRT